MIFEVVLIMYDNNIGSTLKALAKFFGWLGIIVSVISGFVLVGLSGTNEGVALIGLGIMFGGSLVSWLSSLGLYGFGQLIENTSKLVDQQNNTNEGQTQIDSRQQEIVVKKCTQCGTEFVGNFCSKCGTKATAETPLLGQRHQ